MAWAARIVLSAAAIAQGTASRPGLGHDQRADPGADQGTAQNDQSCGEALHGESRSSKPCNPASGHDRDKGYGIGRKPSKIVEHSGEGPIDGPTNLRKPQKSLGQRRHRRRQSRADLISHALKDLTHTDQGQLCPSQGAERPLIKHHPKPRRPLAQPRHLRATVLQQGNEPRGIRGHRLEIEGHLLAVDARLLQA
jgi:hypothetical protein